MKPACWNGEHHLLLPDHIADWDATANWERARFASMQRHLTPEMVLFDIGTEHGSISAVYARWVRTMVLFEPSPDFWPNIRMTWEANQLPPPAAWFVGLVGTDDHPDPDVDYDDRDINGWPACAWSDDETPAMPYRYTHNEKHAVTTRHTSIDAWIARHHITPDAITIDVEGAELDVLRGASWTLDTVRPVVWVSIHPDLMERDYPGATREVLQAYMGERGYRGEHLGTDHEEHHLFMPR